MSSVELFILNKTIDDIVATCNATEECTGCRYRNTCISLGCKPLPLSEYTNDQIIEMITKKGGDIHE